MILRSGVETLTVLRLGSTTQNSWQPCSRHIASRSAISEKERELRSRVRGRRADSHHHRSHHRGYSRCNENRQPTTHVPEAGGMRVPFLPSLARSRTAPAVPLTVAEPLNDHALKTPA